MDDAAKAHVVNSRFIQFNPTINSGHILTACSVILASAFAWAQLRSDVNVLLEEKKQRENAAVVEQAKNESVRSEIYQKMAQNQVYMQGEVNSLHTDITSGFNRLEDKLDRKADKK